METRWECPRCTFKNPLTDLTCALCGNKAVLQTINPGIEEIKGGTTGVLKASIGAPRMAAPAPAPAPCCPILFPSAHDVILGHAKIFDFYYPNSRCERLDPRRLHGLRQVLDLFRALKIPTREKESVLDIGSIHETPLISSIVCLEYPTRKETMLRVLEPDAIAKIQKEIQEEFEHKKLAVADNLNTDLKQVAYNITLDFWDKGFTNIPLNVYYDKALNFIVVAFNPWRMNEIQRRTVNSKTPDRESIAKQIGLVYG